MTMLVAKPSVVGSTIMTRNAFGHEASLPDASFSTLFDFSGRVLATARGAQPPADCTCGTCGVCVAAGGGWVSPRDNSQQRASPRRPPRPSLLRSTRSAEHLGRRQYEFDAFDVKSETASSLVASLGAAAATPPPGAKLTDGEWVWMTSEDWRLLEEFTEAAAGATEMLKEQRGALELAEKSPNGGGGLVLTGEEVLLKELQQMRLQLAATQAEKSRLEQDNTELLKNCHFLHAQNVELKQKRATRPRLNLGQSTFPRKSNMANMDCSPVAEDAVC